MRPRCRSGCAPSSARARHPRLVFDAGHGLAAAHEAGIIHSRLQAAQRAAQYVGWRIVVGDFGLATGLDTQVAIADIPREAHTALTRDGLGSRHAAYMAPAAMERRNRSSRPPISSRSASRCGKRSPVTGRTRRDDRRARKAVTAGPEKLGATAIPMRLRGVIKRGLDPRIPASRWPNMTAMIAALRPDRGALVLGRGGGLCGAEYERRRARADPGERHPTADAEIAQGYDSPPSASSIGRASRSESARWPRPRRQAERRAARSTARSQRVSRRGRRDRSRGVAPVRKK